MKKCLFSNAAEISKREHAEVTAINNYINGIPLFRFFVKKTDGGFFRRRQ